MATEELTVPKTIFTNKFISSNTSPDQLKIADIITVYKKQDVNDKTTDFQLLQKISEKVFYSRLKTVPNKIFSPKLCGFRKGNSSKNTVSNVSNNSQKCLDSSLYCSYLTDKIPTKIFFSISRKISYTSPKKLKLFILNIF